MSEEDVLGVCGLYGEPVRAERARRKRGEDEKEGGGEGPISTSIYQVPLFGIWTDVSTHRIKVDSDTTNVGSTDWNHCEMSVPPSSKQSHSLIQDKEILQSVSDVWRDGEEVA